MKKTLLLTAFLVFASFAFADYDQGPIPAEKVSVDTTEFTTITDTVATAQETFEAIDLLLGAGGSGSMVYPASGIAVSNGTGWGSSVTDNSTNWNTAYGWGNHADEGYLTAENDPYAVLTLGRSGGQTIRGGTGEGENLSFWTNNTGVVGSYYLTDLTDNGFVKTSGATGLLSIDTTTYLTSEVDSVVGAITGIVKANGAGAISAATAGTDYQSPLTAGTDYLTPTGDGSGLSGVVTSESDPNALLTAGTDNVKDTHIDWGSEASQVDMDDIPNSATYVKTENNYDDSAVSKLGGIEASADVTDATNVATAGAVMEADTTTASMSFVVDEDDMSSNLDTKVPTQQSVKSYVDASGNASYEFGSNSFNGTGNFTTSGNISGTNATWSGKADYEYGSNAFNGTGNYTTTGTITGGVGNFTGNVTGGAGNFTGNFTVATGKNITVGTTQWNSGDGVDGEQVANDTIDDDSLDFGTGADQISASDMPDEDIGEISISSGVYSLEDSLAVTSWSLTTPIIIGGASFNNAATSSGFFSIYEDTDDGSNYTKIQAVAQAGDITYSLPPDDGESGEQLQTNGSGVLTWEAAGGAASGDVTGVGDCADNDCFTGTTGTTLTFNNAGGDGVMDYDGTDFGFTKPLDITGGLTTSTDIIVTGSDLTLGVAGVKLTGDGDGAITFLGLGDGYDEDITLNLDDTENTLDVTSSTGVVAIDLSDFDISFKAVSIEAGAYVAASIDGDDVNSNIAGRSLTLTAASPDTFDADAELYTDTKCIRWENPTAADDFKSIWYTPIAATLTQIWAESDQTVTFMLQIDDSSPADVDSVDLAPAAGVASDTSLNGDVTMAAGDRLDLDLVSVSGTPTWCTICWTVTYDD